MNKIKNLKSLHNESLIHQIMIFNDSPTDKELMHNFWTTSKINYNVKIYKKTDKGYVEIKQNSQEKS